MKTRFFMVLMAVLASVLSVSAQKDKWTPTGNWPFLNKKFMVATVVSGFVTPKKTVVPCNIHVGNQTLWYSDNDTLMEALPGSILRVEFSDSSVYVPVSGNTFGKIIHEDEHGRIINVKLVDFKKMKQDARGRNLNAFTLDGNGLFPSITIDMINSYDSRPDDQPLPLLNEFYFLIDKQLFKATEKNIINHIPAERRKEFRPFLRSAEIIMENESSIMKIWNEFFAK
ncbi:MAG: hypothetical protein IKP43_03800 [Bacteroidaceae bacterium]|nr:hypothetical protein [Bacteroidaceae bacterium]